jgi:hypothetical protein
MEVQVRATALEIGHSALSLFAECVFGSGGILLFSPEGNPKPVMALYWQDISKSGPVEKSGFSGITSLGLQ